MDGDRQDEQGRLLTSREVADLLRVSVRYVHRQVAEGRLQALVLQTGSRPMHRFRQAWVDAWVCRFVEERNVDPDIR